MAETPTAVEPDDSAREARTFVVLGGAAGFTAWDIGFDWGAFDNVDHRRIWAIWILCTIALVAGYVFPDSEFGLVRNWRVVFAIPTLWLLADVTFASSSNAVLVLLAVLSVATLPFALYLLAKLLAGDFFTLARRSQIALGALILVILLVGTYVGNGHQRFLSCQDFARSGDFVPPDCAE